MVCVVYTYFRHQVKNRPPEIVRPYSMHLFYIHEATALLGHTIGYSGNYIPITNTSIWKNNTFSFTTDISP